MPAERGQQPVFRRPIKSVGERGHVIRSDEVQQLLPIVQDARHIGSGQRPADTIRVCGDRLPDDIEIMLLDVQSTGRTFWMPCSVPITAVDGEPYCRSAGDIAANRPIRKIGVGKRTRLESRGASGTHAGFDDPENQMRGGEFHEGNEL